MSTARKSQSLYFHYIARGNEETEYKVLSRNTRLSQFRCKTSEDRVELLMISKVLLLAMILVRIQGVPQGPSYLPPNTGAAPRGGGNGHPDDWAGDPANYEFSYEVQDAGIGVDFGHREMRKDDEAKGSYHVLLPDGRTQIVEYVADAGGYRPMIRYEGTASYPASSGDEGYKY